jgi:hypothetical protein
MVSGERLLLACKPSHLVIPTVGRDLWVAEKQGIVEEQRACFFSETA